MSEDSSRLAPGGGPQLAERARRIGLTEDRRASDEDVRPCCDHGGGVGLLDAAVDATTARDACLSNNCTHGSDFRLAARDKGLAAEPRIDRHHQHVVEIGGDVLERGQRASPD